MVDSVAGEVEGEVGEGDAEQAKLVDRQALETEHGEKGGACAMTEGDHRGMPEIGNDFVAGTVNVAKSARKGGKDGKSGERRLATGTDPVKEVAHATGCKREEGRRQG